MRAGISVRMWCGLGLKILGVWVSGGDSARAEIGPRSGRDRRSDGEVKSGGVSSAAWQLHPEGDALHRDVVDLAVVRVEERHTLLRK